VDATDFQRLSFREQLTTLRANYPEIKVDTITVKKINVQY